VNNGALTAGHARALLNTESPALLAQEIVSKNLSVRQAEALAKKNAGAKFKSHKKPAQPKDADLLALEKDLSDKLGMNVVMNMANNQKGVMQIEFSSLDQLDLLLKKLG
jgi:ParB family transcriptional regulator, chromosome partitioning protein